MAFFLHFWAVDENSRQKWFDHKRKVDFWTPVRFANECSDSVANLTAPATQDEGAEKRLFSLSINDLIESV